MHARAELGHQVAERARLPALVERLEALRHAVFRRRDLVGVDGIELLAGAPARPVPKDQRLTPDRVLRGSGLVRRRAPVDVREADAGQEPGGLDAMLHGHDVQSRRASACSSSSVSRRSEAFAAVMMRSIRARSLAMPRCSSQNTMFDSPLIGPTSIRCSRPTTDAGTPLYTRSASSRSPLRKAFTTAAACTPVPVRNASAPSAG